jgi:hypothetical protein
LNKIQTLANRCNRILESIKIEYNKVIIFLINNDIYIKYSIYVYQKIIYKYFYKNPSELQEKLFLFSHYWKYNYGKIVFI